MKLVQKRSIADILLRFQPNYNNLILGQESLTFTFLVIQMFLGLYLKFSPNPYATVHAKLINHLLKKAKPETFGKPAS